MPVAFAPAWSPPVVTARGTAYLRLAEFRDVWAGLGPEDRRYFAEDLRELLVDAVLPETASVPSAPEKRGTPGRR
jgi:hypothetical protein